MIKNNRISRWYTKLYTYTIHIISLCNDHIDRDLDRWRHVEVICTQGTSGAPRSATGPPRRRRCAGRCCRWAGWTFPMGKTWENHGKTVEKTRETMEKLWEFEVFLNFLDLFGGIVDRILVFDPMLWAWNGLNHQWLVIFNNQKMDIYIHTAMGYNII